MLNVPAGKSISVANVEEACKTGKPTTGKKGSSSSGIRARRPKKRSFEDNSAEESSDSESSSDSQHSDKTKGGRKEMQVIPMYSPEVLTTYRKRTLLPLP